MPAQRCASVCVGRCVFVLCVDLFLSSRFCVAGHGQIREKCLEVMSNTLGQQGPKGLLATARSLVESKDSVRIGCLSHLKIFQRGHKGTQGDATARCPGQAKRTRPKTPATSSGKNSRAKAGLQWEPNAGDLRLGCLSSACQHEEQTPAFLVVLRVQMLYRSALLDESGPRQRTSLFYSATEGAWACEVS